MLTECHYTNLTVAFPVCVSLEANMTGMKTTAYAHKLNGTNWRRNPDT